jgi:hypothetical protein
VADIVHLKTLASNEQALFLLHIALYIVRYIELDATCILYFFKGSTTYSKLTNIEYVNFL